MMLVMKVNDNAHYDDDNDDDDDNDYEITKSNDDYAEAHLFFFCIRIHHNCPQHLDQKYSSDLWFRLSSYLNLGY